MVSIWRLWRSLCHEVTAILQVRGKTLHLHYNGKKEMQHKDIVAELARRLERGEADVEALADGFASLLKEHCGALETVAVPGFGKFEGEKLMERVEVDSASGRRMLYPPEIRMTFVPGTRLKTALRRKEKPAMSNRVLVLQDIVKALSHETDTSEALCQSFVKELFAIVAERLMDGESVKLKGVGRFDVDGGEVRFVADPDTAAAINSAFDCFEAIELADDFDGDEPVAEDETPDADEEEAATTADETAGTEDVADESPADGVEPEEKESQTDGLEESEADSEEEKEEDTAEADADDETVAEETAEEETEETAEEEAEETVEEEYDDEPQSKRGGCRFAWGFLAGFVTAAVVAAVAWFCLFGVVKNRRLSLL